MKRKAILGIILTISILMCAGCASADDENTEVQVVGDVQEEIEESISTPTPEVVKEEIKEEAVQEEAESEELAPIPERTYDMGMASNQFHFEMELVNEETYQLLKTEYDKIDFSSVFQVGSEECYEEYLNKYQALIRNELPFTDTETNTEKFLKDIASMQNPEGNYDAEQNDFFLFDMDGDTCQELYVRTRLGDTYIFKYVKEQDEIVTWLFYENCPYYSVHGTKAMSWTDDGLSYGFYIMDENGKEDINAYFYELEDRNLKTGEGEVVYMVALPEYADEGRGIAMTKALQEQSYYNGVRYYFRVTKEQYEEMTNRFFEAQLQVKENKKAVRIEVTNTSVSSIKEEKLPNQLYAEYDGKIYFRRYSAEDKVPGELFGAFRDAAEVTEKDLMCMDSEGNVEKIGTDSGIGTMLIFDGYLYSVKRDAMDDSEFYTYNQVYSCKLDGTEEINYESTDVVGMLGSYLVCTGKEKKLFIIDTVTREEKLLASDADEYLFTADNQVYFVSYPEVTEAVIYRVTADGVKSEIAKMTVDDLKKISETDANYISVVCSQIAGDKLYFAAGYYAGSAHMYQGGMMARMNADGTEFEILGEFLPDSFYILNSEPENIVGGKKLGRSYFSEDLALCYIKDADSAEEVLLTQEEYESLGMGGYSDYQGDNCWEISEVELTGDKLFFTISTGQHDASQDIGWRYYYTREKTAVFCKDMKTGEIRELYAY